MKKKILTAAMAISMVSILLVGASLAYFTDKDKATNTFTVGNVDIAIEEEFEPNSKLLPGSKTLNNVPKEVRIANTGSEEAYVRVHLGIPTRLDDSNPTFDANKNVLHFNYQAESVVEGLWNWAPENGINEQDWNYYKTSINGVDYTVYVVTYETALAPNSITEKPAMHQVYLDSKTTNEDILELKRLGVIDANNNFNFLVFAEGVQVGEFGTAYEAFRTAFPTIQEGYKPFVDNFSN